MILDIWYMFQDICEIFDIYEIFVIYLPIIGLCCPGPSPVLGGTLSKVCALSFSPLQKCSSASNFDIFVKNIFREYLCKDILEKNKSSYICGNFSLTFCRLHTFYKNKMRRKNAVLKNWFPKNIATFYFESFLYLKFTTKLSRTKDCCMNQFLPCTFVAQIYSNCTDKYLSIRRQDQLNALNK